MNCIKTFSIETSCDDTSIALVKFDWSSFSVEKMLSYSQISYHQKYWWVVPEVASRLHEEKIITLLENFWKTNIDKADFISVTSSPWLPGSLIVGINVAYTLWNFLEKPVVEVNHIHGHIFSLFLERKIDEFNFPLVVLTASGWHNELYLIDYNEKNKIIIDKIWYTLDDAAWEAFDKVARMLGWPYPWWPWISKMASFYKPEDDLKYLENIVFKKIKPIFLSSDKYEFSFSWYKSQVYYLLKELEKNWIKLNDKIISLIAYRFQEVVVEVLAKKLVKAAIKFNAKTVWITWWVSANDRLFEYTKNLLEKKLNQKKIHEDIKLVRPVKKMYSTDNAAMIWVVGILKRLWIL